MNDFTEADVTAMRRDGSFREFLRHEMRTGRPAAAPKAPPTRVPGHRPGGWPSGTSPPGPVSVQPPGAWDAAVAEYRAWVAAGRPQGDHECGCGCTPPEDDRSDR